MIRNVEEASEGSDAPLRDLEARAHRSRPLSDRGHHRFAITPRPRLCGVNCQYNSALKERKISMRRFIKIGMDAKHISIDKIEVVWVVYKVRTVCVCSITFICELFVPLELSFINLCLRSLAYLLFD